MNLTKDWWRGEIDWNTPAGELLQAFVKTLPADRAFHLTLFGSAPLQLSVDRRLLSGDVDLFSDEDEDISVFIENAGLGRSQGGLHLEQGHELSFRTHPRWRQRAKVVQLGKVTLTIPHPTDILIAKLSRLEAKDLIAFKRTIQLTGHPTEDELKVDLRGAVDLFRPAFEEDSPNRLPGNTARLWRELFGKEINVRAEIIEPALARRAKGYGENPPDYLRELGA